MAAGLAAWTGRSWCCRKSCSPSLPCLVDRGLGRLNGKREHDDRRWNAWLQTVRIELNSLCLLTLFHPTCDCLALSALDSYRYVHSDCGGDHRYTGGDLVRWVAHCAFGSIMRLHGNDHRPWSYDDEIEADIRHYLLTRARLAPSLIAAGHRATTTAFPPVARADFYWPEHAPAAASNSQYVFLDSVLVAPMDTVCYERSGSPDTETNGGACDPAAGSVPPRSAQMHGWGWKCGSSTSCNTNASGGFTQSSRSVWIPPGALCHCLAPVHCLCLCHAWPWAP
jgi:hypothetical protein